jgi:hypothetical protein
MDLSGSYISAVTEKAPQARLTNDTGLIEAVDRTRSPQRAWIRMPIELIEGPIHRCEPWAKGVSRRTFQRAPIRELQDRQAAFRDQSRRK